jgi:alpha-glucosidase
MLQDSNKQNEVWFKVSKLAGTILFTIPEFQCMKKQSQPIIRLVYFLIFIVYHTHPIYSQQKEVYSPDGKIAVTFTGGQNRKISVMFSDRQGVTIENPALIINGHKAGTPSFSTTTNSVNKVQQPLIQEKRARVTDHYNELEISFNDQTGLIIRAYNDGFAYRFYTRYSVDTILVNDETGTITFSSGDSLYLSLIKCRDEKNVDCFHTSFEEDFVHTSVGAVSPASLAYLPLYARTRNGISLAITESDLQDYPGMFVSGSDSEKNTLKLRFPAFPVRTSVYGDYFKQELVTQRAPYIARTSGNRDYPWRVFILGEHDKDLVNSDMVYRLAPACKLTETGWIRPGQITDEWITNSILYDVDFKSGINTKTYKYYIDFASRFGLDYIFLDAGWCDIDDFSKITPGMDIVEIVRYGAEKGVGIWLWTNALTLKHNMSYMKQFHDWGIKGIMADFMDREDQLMVRFQETVAREAAAHKLMVLFHGASKPSGLRKAYPNVLIREGVMGHEYDKWSDRLTPEHNLILPFTRMIAGPLDYEGGGMVNAQKNSFRIVDAVPMTQGTRIHQLAMYVVYESPLQFLGGNISDYLREPEYAAFYGSIPFVWDETRVLDGKISDYILVARKSGNEWWVGAMTDWTPRTLELDLSFLGDGKYTAVIYQDGMNADQIASDYKTSRQTFTAQSKLQIKMAPGGGWVAHFNKE